VPEFGALATASERCAACSSHVGGVHSADQQLQPTASSAALSPLLVVLLLHRALQATQRSATPNPSTCRCRSPQDTVTPPPQAGEGASPCGVVVATVALAAEALAAVPLAAAAAAAAAGAASSTVTCGWCQLTKPRSPSTQPVVPGAAGMCVCMCMCVCVCMCASVRPGVVVLRQTLGGAQGSLCSETVADLRWCCEAREGVVRTLGPQQHKRAVTILL
jgi:hypothetical protein